MHIMCFGEQSKHYNVPFWYDKTWLGGQINIITYSSDARRRIYHTSPLKKNIRTQLGE